MSGIPVVISDHGIPVRAVERGAPVMTVSDTGIPIRLSDHGTPFVVEGLSPSVITFQTFNMTAGQEGQWIGYSTGVPTTPQPSFGSIDRQASPETDLLAFYDDTASGVFLVVFQGNYVTQLAELQLSIGGFVVDSFSFELISGNTWVRFNGIPGDLSPGATYEVLFGMELAPTVYDPSAQALFARFDVQPSDQRKRLINERFIAGKATTWWAKLDALWVHAAHGAEAGRLNWLSTRFNCLPVNGPAFTVDRGYMGDGVTSYLNTQFNPTTATGVNYAQDGGCLAIRSNTENSQAGSLAGFWDGSKGTTINPSNTNTRATIRVNQATDVIGGVGSGATSIGLFAANRESNTTVRLFRNGAQIVGSATSASLAPANGSFRLGSISNDSLRACQFSMGYIGGNLSAAEHLSIFNWFETYRQAVGVT